MREKVCQGIVFCVIGNNVSVLVCRRGDAARSEQGKWCIPGGHLEDNETTKQCVSREVKEETNVDIPPKAWTQYNIDSDPHMPVVCINFISVLSGDSNAAATCSNINVPDEISDVRFIDMDDIDSIDWAFNKEKIFSLIQSAYIYITKKELNV